MYVRLLGEVAVAHEGGWRRAGAARQAGVLAVLAMSPGRAVSLDTLANRLWGADAPATQRSVLYAHIARLRRLIEPLPDVAITRGGKAGYRLDVEEARVDVFAMRAFADRARGASADGDHAAAIVHWRQAEGHWRGHPLGNVEGPWAERMRAGLVREHGEILAGWFEAALVLGDHGGILGALTEAADRHPHSEVFAGQLIRALYMDGRQAEALERYARIAVRLRDDLGIDPGTALRALHRSILRSDPLRPQRKDVPRQLPPPPAGIVGRDGQCADLDGRLDAGGVPILLVTGMAGLGKTSVVLHWAHRAAGRFTDGQLFVDLKGFDAAPTREPEEVLAGFLSALGVPGRDIPDSLDDRVALYRSRTAGRRLLVVLDNAADPGHVRLLTPTGAGSVVLVTSRDRLSGLVARDGARHIALDVLTAGEAGLLLVERLGEGRIAAEPDAVAELIELCGRLPLALRIAAAQLAERPGTTVAEHVRELTGDRLRALSIPGDSSAAVRPAFEVSYLRLAEDARAVFRALGQVPGPDVPTDAVAVLADGEAVDPLRRLAAAHLVQPTGPGRYRLHDLLKEYARLLSDGPSARRSWERLAAWYVHAARAASNVISPGSAALPITGAIAVPHFDGLAAVMTWFGAELDNLLAVFRAAVSDGPPEITWLLAEALRLYLGRSTNYPAFKEVVGTALGLAERHRNLPAVAAMRSHLALLAKVTGDLPASIDWAVKAVDAAREAGDTGRLADALCSLAGTRYTLGQLAETVADCEEALALPGIGLREETLLLGINGKACRELGRLHEALDALNRKGELLHGIEHRMAEVHGELALAHLSLGELPCALDAARRAAAASTLGNTAERAVRADTLAYVLTAMGDLEQARTTILPGLALVSKDHDKLFRVPLLITASRCHTGSDAVAYAEQALELATGLGGLWVLTDAHNAAADAHLRAGDSVRAADHARQAETTAAEHGYRQLQAEALLLLARASRSPETAERALALNREIGARLGESHALALLADLTEAPELAALADRLHAACRTGA